MKVLFGTLPQHEIAGMFQISSDVLQIPRPYSFHMHQALDVLMKEPWGRYMLSNRRILSNTNYEFLLRGEMINDTQLRRKYIAGINFAWSLMGGAWVNLFFKNMGSVFASYFLAETYEQFYTTYYKMYVLPEKDKRKELPVVDSYIVTLLANIEMSLPEEAVVLMGSAIVYFMKVPVADIQILRQRADEIVSKVKRGEFTLH